MAIVTPSLTYFPSKDKGRPLSEGYVYVGQINLDPTVVANQKVVTLKLSSGGTVSPAPQPLRTSAGGIVVYNDDYAVMTTIGDFSLAAYNKDHEPLDPPDPEDLEYYIPNNAAIFDLSQISGSMNGNAIDDMNAYIDAQTSLTYSDLDAIPSDLVEDGFESMVTAEGIAGPWVAHTGVHTANIGTIRTFGDNAGRYWERRYDGVIYSTWFGVIGNNSGSPYTTELVNIFAITDANKIAFANAVIHFDNTSGALSFQSNTVYEGGANTVFQITNPSQRCFATVSKSNMQLKNIRVYGTEGVGDESLYIGGGYFRFDTCTDILIESCESSNSFGGGLKLADSTNFTIRDWVSNYNQFTGIELQGCSDYLIENWTSSKNGRYSTTDGFKPLPSGWTGTHGGRGWVVGGNGSNVDQKNSKIGFGKGELNSEYGGRVFAATTPAPTNLMLEDHTYADNGAPAGTYGTIVLATAKGVDLLINSDPIGHSDNIRWTDIQISRSVNYGQALSSDGNNHRQTRVKIAAIGAAKHVVTGLSLFRGDGFVSEDFETSGVSLHCVFGSGLPTNVEFRNCIGTDNLKAFQGNPGGGVNKLTGGTFTHRATAAIAGESGITMNATRWDIHKVTFDGYYYGIEPQGSAPAGSVTECTTTNTVGVNGGFWGSSIVDQSSLTVESNNFDTAFPGIFATFVHNRTGSLNRRMWFWNTSPDTGGANAGGSMTWALGDRVINAAGTVGNPKEWVCTTVGTPGVFTSTGNL